MSALQGIRIVELAEGVAGEYCGKLLSDFGADVVKIERPETGSPTRHMAPILEGSGGGEVSGLFAYLNTNKKSVALDLDSPAGNDALHELISIADVVIDDHDADWLRRVNLAPDQAEKDRPSVVFCSITPYGIGAPREFWNAKSLNVFHDSGWGFHTPATADTSRPPLKGPGRFLVDYEAALDAALCIVSSLFWRGRTGNGQFLDISALEVQISRADIVVGRMLAGDDEASNKRLAYSQGGPHAFFRCNDGIVYLYMTSRKHWAGLKALMGDPEWARRFDEDWLEFKATDDAVAECRARFGEWVRTKNREAVTDEAQRLGVPLVSVNDAADLRRSPQFQFRKFFQGLNHPVLGEALYPTVPYLFSVTPTKLSTPAPALNAQGDLLRAPRPAAVRPAKNGTDQPVSARATRSGPLAGVRVLELTKVWAGPYAGKLLAFLGAEVIKIESRKNLDEMRAYGGVDIDHAPYFLSLNPEILSAQLNLKSDKGLELLRSLVAKSDIVLNNLAPGAMERMGMGYEQMRAIKSDIISVSMKMYGNDGPLGYQTGYAPCFAALGGLNYLVGYEGEQPTGINMRYGDSSVGANAAFAAIVALLHRQRTGEGQFVDVSAVESLASLVGDSLFGFNLTGAIPGPDGNLHADMAPHGCYPCLDKEWISIAISNDTEWRALCAVLGRTSLMQDARYADLKGRQANRKLLDEQIAELTRTHDARALAAHLRAAGVPASKSQTSLDLVGDERLWAHIFRLVSDGKVGSRPIVAAPWRLSRTPISIANGAPRLGEHNDYVYHDILKLPDATLQQLIRDGVVD